MAKNIAIITARSGSKRIPGKNIRLFLGKPIISYSIDAAKNSGCFDEVMVSTDDYEIVNIAKRFGAKVPFLRSNKNSSDTATTEDVLREVVKKYEKLGKKYDNICCVYPTAPFVTPRKIQKGLVMLEELEVDSVITIVKFSFAIQRALTMENGLIHFVESANALKRSQDCQEMFYDAGQFYWVKTAEFMKKGHILTDATAGLIISELEAQDIDNETDWKLAEIKYSLQIKS